jgi:hypothetical protein
MPRGLFEAYFEGSGFVPDKALDDPGAALFRKHEALRAIVEERKPSSAVTMDALCENGPGSVMRQHLLWLRDEGSTVRGASHWGVDRFAPRMAASAERGVRARLLRQHSVLQRLYRAAASVAK